MLTGEEDTRLELDSRIATHLCDRNAALSEDRFQVLQRDDAVDERYGEILRAMMEFMAHSPDEIPSAVRVIKVAKYIEWVADHATNIAEEVIFMVRAKTCATCAPTRPLRSRGAESRTSRHRVE
jgi:hypothetical protein